MLDHSRLYTALQKAHPGLSAQLAKTQKSKEHLVSKLPQLAAFSLKEIENHISNHPELDRMYPTSEWDHTRQLIIPRHLKWQNFRHALSWAQKTAAPYPITAVSSDFALSEQGIPVGLIQIGLYEKYYQSESGSKHEIETILLCPDDTPDIFPPTSSLRKDRLNRLCFQLKINKLIDYMNEGEDLIPQSISLFDSPLRPLPPTLQNNHSNHIAELKLLLETTTETQMPVIGYIKKSPSQDFVKLMCSLFNTSTPTAITDVEFLKGHMEFGQRTQLFSCPFDSSSPKTTEFDIGFCYLQTTLNQPPIRIEVPLWIVDENLVDIMMDLILAECVMGHEQPATLEAARGITTLTQSDRDLFKSLVQQLFS